ncbi:MAG: type II secretion system protein [Patescibacteria group bacterium]
MKRWVNGFTLIEVMIAVALIALLAGLVMAGFGNSQKNARNRQTITAVRNYKTALGAYLADRGHYPMPEQASYEYCLGLGYKDLIGTPDGDCRGGAANITEHAPLMDEISDYIGNPEPVSERRIWDFGRSVDLYGAYLIKDPLATVDGVSSSYFIEYGLEGESRDCVLTEVVDTSVWPATTRTSAKSSYTSGGFTICTIALQSPD